MLAISKIENVSARVETGDHFQSSFFHLQDAIATLNATMIILRLIGEVGRQRSQTGRVSSKKYSSHEQLWGH